MEQFTTAQEKKSGSDDKVKAEPYIIFNVAGTTYAIHSKHVRQMEMIANITPVPNAPHYVEGVMFSRGDVVPVINLRTRLGLEKIPYNIITRVIVIKHEERTIGLIADSAKEYMDIPASAMQDTPELISASGSSWLSGIARLGDRTILIFNINEVVKSEDIKNK